MTIGFVAEPYERKEASGMGYLVQAYLTEFATRSPECSLVIYSFVPIDSDYIPGTYKNVLIPKNFLTKLWWFRTHALPVDFLMFSVPMLPLSTPRSVPTIPIVIEIGSQAIPPRGSLGERLYHHLFTYIRDYILVPTSLRRAQAVLTATNSVREDIYKEYGVAKENILVAPLGFQSLSTLVQDQNEDTVATPYFFFTGKLKSRKNVHGIVAGFIEFKKKTNLPTRLIISGSSEGAYKNELLSMLDAAGLANDVEFVGYITATQLATYYAHAVAFVFPSLSEGFGMPLLEAMQCGCPVITSNIPVLTEVGGDAALYVDPHSSASISSAMEAMATDTHVREEYIRKGRARAELFSWKHMGDVLVARLSSMVSKE